jgi:PHD/YefM family antitoxin component YafN of YafNO toxin-antitoxin module
VEPTTINASDLRLRFREIMERVKYKGECFKVQTFGQPTAMIIGIDEYTRMLERLDAKQIEKCAKSEESTAES